MQTHLNSRRQFLHKSIGGILTLTLVPSLYARVAIDSQKEPVKWYDVRDQGIEGKGWEDTKRYFDRLPAKAEGVVREPVWNLSQHSAGMRVRFNTDATTLNVRYRLLNENLAMPHMPATGVSGLDLYGQDAQGIDRWVAVVRPTEIEIETEIAKDLTPGMRRYTLYLPLYNGVESLEIGTPDGSMFEPLPPRKEAPMVFYGTSILHGACASRPGMAFPSILSRRLKRPFLNLGFSGNGRMEKEVGDLLSELDPCVYALDCVPNMDAEMINERLVPLVKSLRSAHPTTPILVVEDRSFTNTQFFTERKERHTNNREALKKGYTELLNSGVSDLYYLEGEQLLGLDGEAATDGSHPNDLGMVRYANAYEPALRSILKQY
ncbi:MAG: SGNH/GDSL hydrolase family protein [Bacteroidetes bacterium]|nr:SGNH/GDSL hydrolase family protein [Bacteroidota bacterium]MDA1121825.1 SGNH/GDSL hydrolase family protein [Bacteroidota bacterium]